MGRDIVWPVACDGAPPKTNAGSDKSKAAGASTDAPKARKPAGGIAVMAQGEQVVPSNGIMRPAVLHPRVRVKGLEGPLTEKIATPLYARGGLAPGEYTIEVEARGYVNQSRKVNVDDGYIEAVAFTMRPGGYVRTAKNQPVKSLVSVHGSEVKTHSAFPTGLYRVPGRKDVYIGVVADRTTRLPPADGTEPSAIVVAGKKVALDAPVRVVRWDDKGGFDDPGLSAARGPRTSRACSRHGFTTARE